MMYEILQTSIKAAVKVGAHAQGTLSYTESPVHTLEGWLTMAKQLEDMGAHSLCIKDMSGLLKPYDAAELITRLKKLWLYLSLYIVMQRQA